MRFVRQSEYIKYDDTFNMVHHVFAIACSKEDTSYSGQGIRRRVLRDAAPVWGPAWDRTNEKLVRDEQEAE